MYVIEHEDGLNPDWMAQAAHSLREILYPFMEGSRKSEAFERYGSTFNRRSCADEIGPYYNVISAIAHHEFASAGQKPLIGGSEQNPVRITKELFGRLVSRFGKILYEVLRRQIDAHREIDKILARGGEYAVADEVNSLISLNPDARQYFFAKADATWFDWLQKNGFLDGIRSNNRGEVRLDPLPELQYLVQIADKIPAKVVDFILEVPVSGENPDRTIISRFLQICKALPADQLARMIERIGRENWIQIMGEAGRWFRYEAMFKSLAEARDFKSVLLLSKALLSVRPTKRPADDYSRPGKNDPFHFSEVADTKVFSYLAEMPAPYAEQALSIAAEALAEIVRAGGAAKAPSLFPCADPHRFYEVDFFTLQTGKARRSSSHRDVTELVAAVKTLACRLIEDNCGDIDMIRGIYKRYVEPLPQSQAMWRLRLVILTACPEAFKEELKQAFFRLVEADRAGYHELLLGTEYKKALQKVFPIFLETDMRSYVDKVLTCFSGNKSDADDREYDKREAAQILSLLWEHLTPDEREAAEKAGIKRIPGYKPEPAISFGRGGWVRPRAPITSEEFGRLPVPEIASRLRGDWAPGRLRAQNTDADFMNPVDAEGIRELLGADIPRRIQAYLDNAALFFDPKTLAPHYTYAYLRGFSEVLHERKEEVDNIDWTPLTELFATVIQAVEAGDLEPAGSAENRNSRLSDWTTILSTLTDVIKELLAEKKGRTPIDFSRSRATLLSILGSLLCYPDPVPEDEEDGTAKIKSRVSGAGDLVSDPLTIAINSVRGRAFETFCYFVYCAGKSFESSSEVKISPDVKTLYEKVLKQEATRALMFLFGHHLATFYYRDRQWLTSLLGDIFPDRREKKHLHLAAWEGYLAANLYKDIFLAPEMQVLYERGLRLTRSADPGRKFQRDPEEGIAKHLALAFVHYPEFGPDHPLFRKFWDNGDIEQHSVFISFIGRAFISTEDERNRELLAERPEIKRRLCDFWDWLLDTYVYTQPLKEFGFWISKDNPVFETPWLATRLRKTLEKAKGSLEWDYGLSDTISRLAKEAPVDTLGLLRQLLLIGTAREKDRNMSFYLDKEYLEALRILYAVPETKSGTYALISDLIRDGGSIFWDLKEIVS